MSKATIDAKDATGAAIIKDPTGLHARPAVKLAKLAKRFEATLEVKTGDGEVWVSAKSLSAVMKLKARHEQTLHLRAEGEDAGAAVTALVELIERNFDD